MLCVKIESGAVNWQIFQRKKQKARLHLFGTYQIHKSCAHCPVESARVVLRVLREQDNGVVIPWTEASVCKADDDSQRSGRWNTALVVPQGGLYRVETALDVKSPEPAANRMFGGDMRYHLGVGDIFVIAGQSNAAGFGMDMAPDQPDLRVHLFRNREIWDLATHPMNESAGAEEALNAEIGCCGTSPWLTFGREVADLTGCPVGLVQTAMGGQPLDRWDNRVCGDLMRNLKERVRHAGGRIAGVLWYQGCTDAVPGRAETYGARFAYVAERLRNAVGRVPVFTMQLNRYLKQDGDDGSWGKLREAQRQAAHTIPWVYVLPTTDLPLSDYIHNSSSGNIRLGMRVAQQYGSVLRGESFGAPDLCSVTAKGDTVYLRFDHADQGLLLLGEEAARRAFSVWDAQGHEQPICAISVLPQHPDTLCLQMAHKVEENWTAAFAWRCDPPAASVVDAITRMPPLSFFGVPIERIIG